MNKIQYPVIRIITIAVGRKFLNLIFHSVQAGSVADDPALFIMFFFHYKLNLYWR